ncbi:hypothetical protein AVEN_151059-1 [Araneus ventricosus]|uniref:Uncharacterized protein n=1 Tax=Araneus ventricosus TaxID=182803 RepID=A0A4Y2RKS3_ARAVE|nr:hypothetical protein AVEN_151059-1 [Araneus ventricosus]
MRSDLIPYYVGSVNIRKYRTVCRTQFPSDCKRVRSCLSTLPDCKSKQLINIRFCVKVPMEPDLYNPAFNSMIPNPPQTALFDRDRTQTVSGA